MSAASRLIGLDTSNSSDEADVAEAHVRALTALAKQAGFHLEFGRSVPLEKAGTTMGRRVAILSRHRLQNVPEFDNPHVAYLESSGRWMERKIAIGAGNQYLLLASF